MPHRLAIRQAVCPGRFHLALVDRDNPGTDDFGNHGRLEDAEGDDGGGDRVHTNPHLWQAEVDEEQQEQEWQVADDVDDKPDNG